MKMKTKAWVLSLLILIGILPLSLWAYSKKPPSEQSPQEVRSTMVLKEYMSHFGSLVAGMEIMKLKEKKPDWEAIQITIDEMDKTLKEMQAADAAGNYKEFTDVLEKNLTEVRSYGMKRNKKVYESFDKLTQTCFQCHAAHRPSDFLIPKQKDPRISGGPGK
jgi:hypothetical protein